MKISVVGGAGAQAKAVIKDLMQNRHLSEILIIDLNEEGSRRFAAEMENRPGTHAKVSTICLDVFDYDKLVEAVKGSDAAIDTTHQDCGVAVARGVIEAGVNGCTLGSTHMIAKETMAFDAEAKTAGITYLVSAGAYPGASGITAKYLADKMDQAEDVDLSMVIFRPISRSPALVDVFMTLLPGDGLVYEDGVLRKVPAFSQWEEIEYPEPFGRHIVYNITSSDPITIPMAIKGVRNIRAKAAYYPDYTEMLRTCYGLGLLSHNPVRVNGRDIAPADVLRELLIHRPVEEGREIVKFVQRVEVTGTKDGAKVEAVIVMPFLPFDGEEEDPETRATGEPGSIIVQMLARGEITQKGVLGPESCIDPRSFMEEWAKRPGVHIHETWTESRTV